MSRKILDVKSVVVTRDPSDPLRINILANGTTATTGWTNPILVLVGQTREHYEFDFYADSPETGQTILTPITANGYVQMIPPFAKTIKINTKTNSIVVDIPAQQEKRLAGKPIALTKMTTLDNSKIPPRGWIGGFSESNPAFAYPNPDLSSLLMLDNMESIHKLQRQQKVRWPQFSWRTNQRKPESRCYQMFAPGISRLGYTNEGRVYSIICPQQGATSRRFGTLNVEITVTGQRGWANEPAKTLAGDMTVEAKIWFSPSANLNKTLKKLWDRFVNGKKPFPSSKKNAIKVPTHKPNDPNEPIFSLNAGQSKEIEVPDFAKHTKDGAWAVGNLSVQIGKIKDSGHESVNRFNRWVMRIFNFASGNMLQAGNILTWNVWFDTPELVDQKEWAAHAKKWRDSIQADHGPEGATKPRYFNGRVFKPFSLFRMKTDEQDEEYAIIEAYLKENGVSKDDPIWDELRLSNDM